jgi:hypothetical protein
MFILTSSFPFRLGLSSGALDTNQQIRFPEKNKNNQSSSGTQPEETLGEKQIPPIG